MLWKTIQSFKEGRTNTARNKSGAEEDEGHSFAGGRDVQWSGVVWLRQVMLLFLEGSMAQAGRRGLVDIVHLCGKRWFSVGF